MKPLWILTIFMVNSLYCVGQTFPVELIHNLTKMQRGVIEFDRISKSNLDNKTVTSTYTLYFNKKKNKHLIEFILINHTYKIITQYKFGKKSYLYFYYDSAGIWSNYSQQIDNNFGIGISEIDLLPINLHFYKIIKKQQYTLTNGFFLVNKNYKSNLTFQIDSISFENDNLKSFQILRLNPDFSLYVDKITKLIIKQTFLNFDSMLVELNIYYNNTLRKTNPSFALLKDTLKKSPSKNQIVDSVFADTQFINKNKLLFFWDIHCYPCRKSLPILDSLAKSNKIVIMGLDPYDRDSNIIYFKNKLRIYNIYLKEDKNKIYEVFKVDSFPTYFLFDKYNNLIKSNEGWTIEFQLYLQNFLKL